MAETEIRDQEQVSAMGRSYDRALAYIDATIDEAERAQLMAEDYKALVFIQAEATLPVAQTALDDAFDMLQRARPILAFQEAQAFDAQLAEMAVALDLARQQVDEGGFADAAARLDEIVIGARAIQTRAQFVIENRAAVSGRSPGAMERPWTAFAVRPESENSGIPDSHRPDLTRISHELSAAAPYTSASAAFPLRRAPRRTVKYALRCPPGARLALTASPALRDENP